VSGSSPPRSLRQSRTDLVFSLFASLVRSSGCTLHGQTWVMSVGCCGRKCGYGEQLGVTQATSWYELGPLCLRGIVRIQFKLFPWHLWDLLSIDIEKRGGSGDESHDAIWARLEVTTTAGRQSLRHRSS